MLTVYRLYRALTVAQRKILSRKIVTRELTANQWLTLLGAVARFDQRGDQLRSFAGKSAAWLAGLFFVALFVLGFLPFWVWATAHLTIIGLFFFFLLLWWRLRKIDLPDTLRMVVVPLFGILREESTGIIKAAIDLRGPLESTKRTEHSPAKNKNYPRVDLSFFCDPWLQVETQLADGSRLVIEAKDFVRERSIAKKNARGKVKYKTKYKGRRLYEVRLAASHKAYRLAESPHPEDGIRMAVKAGEKRDVIKLRRMVPSGDPKTPTLPANIDDLTQLLATAYAQLAPSSQEARA
ncbi:MAG: hypothetical protein AB7G75_10885 [Candidatus Binatia bacterium]